MKGYSVIILGFGTAATSAIVALRDAGYEGRLLVIDKGCGLPYSPVLTSYYAAGLIERDDCFLWDGQDIERYGVDVVYGVEVVSLDAAAHEIAVSDGRVFSYGKCLIATGASPTLSVNDDMRACNPLVLRDMDDADRFASVLQRGDGLRLLVSGTSMVALKSVEACLERGAHATLLGRSPHILRGNAHPACAARFETWLAALGVDMRLSDSVEAASAQEGACEVTFASDGATERYDGVLVAHGVRPNIGFVGEGTLVVDRGVVVDDEMRTSDPDVFAAGDVAQASDIATGGTRVFGLWMTARQQGATAGFAIAAALGCCGHRGFEERLFGGGLMCNTIHVHDIVFASAGTVTCEEGGSLEVEELSDDALLVRAYAPVGQQQRALVGFNVVAHADERGLYPAVLDEIGIMRSEIEKVCLSGQES